ncbi:hypothetical protein FIBSPDRAFT_962349 [Athelia psychrophila]|uniref:Uncharacterized protein n=1 Tax=Athelia psychrophila TaxID=1759441 RepID=A0A166A8J1_9AGAM|nr:hypothetical protein FIBSPDRAFT_962349 [Fibularhizoctonia sp. CBS 109695]
MLQFQIPSFVIFNNIVRFVLYILAIIKPLFSPLTPPYPTSGSSGMSRVYSSVRPSRRPVPRVGPDKVVFKDASSTKNVYSVHLFCKTAVYKGIQRSNDDNAMSTLVHAPHAMRNMIYAHYYAYNHLALFQPEIGDFTHGLVKACIDPRQRDASPFAPAVGQVLCLREYARSRHRFRGHATDEMSRSPDTVAKLQAEPDASMPEPLAIPDIRTLQHLPYLSPLIQDGLRVHGAVPSLPERVIPSPPPKAVSPTSPSTSWTTHSHPAPSSPPRLAPCTRDHTAFLPLLTFLPDRWLSVIEDQLAQMQAHFIPFCMGSWIWGNGARDDDDASPGPLRSMRRKGQMRRVWTRGIAS